MEGLKIFKYLPGAKKLPESNCKKCGFATCMAYALKLAKKETDIDKCPFVPSELKELFYESSKIQQHEIKLSESLTAGGETVMFRHDKTFVSRAAIFVTLDTNDPEFEQKLNDIKNYSIERVGEKFKVDGLYLTGKNEKNIEKAKQSSIAVLFEEGENYNLNVIVKGADLNELIEKAQKCLDEKKENIILELDINDLRLHEAVEKLTLIRRRAILERFAPLTYPVLIRMPDYKNIYKTCAAASMFICRYAGILVLREFDKALLSSLFTLRQNIYTNPQKPLQVESKVYEFNEPDENAVILMTTNFALTYFAVANELESMPFGSYLIVTPSDGMSVLTAWSADKFNAEIVAKMMSKTDLASKVKKREIIIPGLLSHMKEELEEALPDWKIIVGTIEAFQLYDFIKNSK